MEWIDAGPAFNDSPKADGMGPFVIDDLHLARLAEAFDDVVPEELHRAISFALVAHGRQVRKYNGEPYVNHTVEVAAILREQLGDEATLDMLQAAVLHDVVEDTVVSVGDIAAAFGDTVADYVDALSDRLWAAADGSDAKPNRKTRKSLEVARAGACLPAVQTIKHADLISNTSSIVSEDPKFARVYLPEKARLLEAMTQADGRLRTLARDTLASGEQALLDDHFRKTGPPQG